MFERYKGGFGGRFYYSGEKTIEDKLVDELNKLTEYKNEEWASYRIRYSLKEILSNYSDFSDFDIDCVSDRIDEQIFNGDPNDQFDPEAPPLYCNFIPIDCQENIESLKRN